MKDAYYYPAIFSYDDDGISIEFPDLQGCLSCAETTEEAIASAKEAMSLHLFGMEQDNDIIPEPAPINKIKVESNQVLTIIEVYMPLIRESIEKSSIKKNI